MPVSHIVGIDPGLVHTGVIRLMLSEGEITVEHTVVAGLDVAAVEEWVGSLGPWPDRIFIEKYDPRMHYSTDERMVKGEAMLKGALRNSVLLRNTGIKQTVPLAVLSVLGLDSFTTRTHHQDLLSAARIAVLGCMKDPDLNKEVAEAVRDKLDGFPWPVNDLGGGLYVTTE